MYRESEIYKSLFYCSVLHQVSLIPESYYQKRCCIQKILVQFDEFESLKYTMIINLIRTFKSYLNEYQLFSYKFSLQRMGLMTSHGQCTVGKNRISAPNMQQFWCYKTVNIYYNNIELFSFEDFSLVLLVKKT